MNLGIGSVSSVHRLLILLLSLRGVWAAKEDSVKLSKHDVLSLVGHLGIDLISPSSHSVGERWFSSFFYPPFKCVGLVKSQKRRTARCLKQQLVQH